MDQLSNKSRNACMVPSRMIVFVLALKVVLVFGARESTFSRKLNSTTCSAELIGTCAPCCSQISQESIEVYNCSLPGLEGFRPGQYAGIKVNYLSFVTQTSSPNMPLRAKEFQDCTGGEIVFSEAENVFEDPILDLGTRSGKGQEVYDGYLMSYSHFPEASSLGLAEHLNERIREDNGRLKWADVLPKVRQMGEYRTGVNTTNLDFLMYDGDFFVPLARLDLLEKFNISLPNTWAEVVQIAKFFNGTDLNDDGEPDYGFCHFPRMGAGYWDWWWPEALYSTWASFGQTSGMNEGIFFDTDTMDPFIRTAGFQEAANIWKDLWQNGADGCITSNFVTGRCAIGFAPPGCWKGVFLNHPGVARRDENGTVIWTPTFKNGDYAEPYRFKPFGSIKVVDKANRNQFTQCTSETCPFAEVIPLAGHHGDNDRASVLPPSPHAGQLINRAPFYWSGGLGTLIRKSSTPQKKQVIWDYFVYTNSPSTSVHDVASYASWLDSWRYNQLVPGENFLSAGWSEDAYFEHKEVMLWALSRDINGALNLRLPGLKKYTSDVLGQEMVVYINDETSLDEMSTRVESGWIDITNSYGKLNQLEIYRASLNIEPHTEVELCRLHREEMDLKDPSICRKYDSTSKQVLIPSIIIPLVVVIISGIALYYMDRKRRAADSVWIIKSKELVFDDPPEIIGRGTFGLVLLAEYRGTQVAVKRVIPPKITKKSGTDSDVKEKDKTNRLVEKFGRMSLIGRGSTSNGIYGSQDTLSSEIKMIATQPPPPTPPAQVILPSPAPVQEVEIQEEKKHKSVIIMGDIEKTTDKFGIETRLQRAKTNSMRSLGEGRPARRSSIDQSGSGGPKHVRAVRRASLGSIDSIAGAMKRRASIEYQSNEYDKHFDVERAEEKKDDGMKSGAFTKVDMEAPRGQQSNGTNGVASTQSVENSQKTKSKKNAKEEYAKLKADFIIEMRHLSKLRHPCITTVMGAVLEKRIEPMLVMEYMDHGSLYDMLHNETMVLDGELLFPILRDIAQGLRFLHAATPLVVHGDLKAANVLVDGKFRAKVADFGLSQKKKIGATGTPYWMAPELLRGDSENTSSSDVYAFGIILYEVYSRKVPYEGENYQTVIREICDPKINKRPPIPSSCPLQIQALMTDCIAADPIKRPTFEEIDERLKRMDAETVAPGEMKLSHQLVKQTNTLLNDVFPPKIAEALRAGRKVEPEYREVVTIFFSDIVGFTNISSTLSPIKVSDMLDRLYNRFDNLSREHDIFKVETIGDAYMAVTNLVKDQPNDHAERIARFSIDAIRAARETVIDLDDPARGTVQIRVGFHSGPVVANVVGSRNPRYCLFGDTVNTASRMESNSKVGRIHCSERAALSLKRQAPDLNIVSRGNIEIKGKGEMHTFWVLN